jgi:type II secretory pathway component PulF
MSLFTPVAIIVLAGVIGTIVASVLLAILSVNDLVG